MSKEYKIMDIRDGKDSRFGDVIVVKANEVSDTGYGKSYTSHVYEGTVTFYYPNRKQILDELISIAQSERFWVPDIEIEFVMKTILDENTGNLKRIYRHVSFYAGQQKKVDSDINEVFAIANRHQKMDMLYQQYKENKWDQQYSFADYVRSLVADDVNTHFYRWLFETTELDGLNPYQIPPKYTSAYILFILDCENYTDLPF